MTARPALLPVPLTIAAGGAYAARLIAGYGDGGWCPERWTLDGPEPYAVRLPGAQPEEADTPLQPLADGRVLIARRADGRYHFTLLYPSTPDTGELSLGAVECERLTLLPPPPGGSRVYALAPREDATALWLVCGGAFGPELVTVLAGQCAGGAWLDQEGRLLALDRTDDAGCTRTVTVDVEHGGEPSELLRIAEDSNDRLLLADPDSGLLLVSSDAPGTERIGWGVLGSHRPVRFPEALHPEGVRVTPFATQPGQVLLPEKCAVALRMTTNVADWVAVWRPQQRELQHLGVPDGWLAGSGLWTVDGQLLLPYAAEHTPCGLARIDVPVLPPAEPGQTAGTPEPAAQEPRAGTGEMPELPEPPDPETTQERDASPEPDASQEPETPREPQDEVRDEARDEVRKAGAAAPAVPPPVAVAKPVPLQQAPLARPG
ncbi:hypothetical protein [Streptomyces sp. MP131-18]|uniref:hypothetical protein n=1 Tax=Streptomyces sp. MP131-18 TaxID=1857892 RepID=UPI00097CB666|nr:hypothetical protein [Streptomyces sp. MP131-18]ONK14727.1 hypothetical protein STBA_55160 [Streptomyces sp. MP131-18]